MTQERDAGYWLVTFTMSGDGPIPQWQLTREHLREFVQWIAVLENYREFVSHMAAVESWVVVQELLGMIMNR